LWSRLGNYEIKILDDMLWRDRTLLEYWVHGASIVLSEDYPLFKLGMKTIVSDIDQYQKRTKDWFETNKKLAIYIKNELSIRGPLTSKEFEDVSERRWRSSGWSNERNVGKMLEILHKKGEIIVQSRTNGGQKKWDLAKKYLATFPKNDLLTDQEIIRKGIEISLRAMGVATELQMRDYFQPGKRETSEVIEIIHELESEGLIIPVEIENIPQRRKGRWFIHSEDLKVLDNLDHYWKPKTTLLSPFDNLIYDRVRTGLLFGFNLVFEAYVPKEKRIFGYYVLPILRGDKLVGRIDPEMDREKKVLKINLIDLEKGFVDSDDEFVSDVADSIRDFASFLGAKKIYLKNSLGPKWKREFNDYQLSS
jgi:uncharacterized protein YcaQ